MSGVFRLADSPVPALVAEAIPYETYFLRPTNGLTSRALAASRASRRSSPTTPTRR
jgi:hypothetical protein